MLQLPSLTGAGIGETLWTTASTHVPRRAGCAIKVVLDQAACRARTLSTDHTPAQWKKIGLEVAAAARLYESRGWLDNPIAYHANPPPLYTPDVSEFRALDHRVRHVSFESGYEPHLGEPGRRRWLAYEANRTAHAWVLQHAQPSRPWLICVHGYGMGIPAVDLRGFPIKWLHQELGFNLLFPVLPLHGPRRIGWWSGEGFFSGDCLDLVHATAQVVWDLRRLLSWVREQGGERIGVYGISLGGYSAALLSAFDADLECVIAGMPPSDFLSLARFHLPHAVRESERCGLDWDVASRMARVISPLAVTPRVEHDRRFLFGGLLDCIVPPRQMKDLWRHWKYPRSAWYPGTHLSYFWEPAVQQLLSDALGKTLSSCNMRAAA